MGKNLKQELGLGERPAGKSKRLETKQAKDFRKAFKATLKQVDGHLQYTAAHAEESRHKTFSEKRDKAYVAYQAALKKIDPADPAAAEDAIDQVTASIEGLEANVKALHEYAEKHYTAWTDNEQQVDDAAEQVFEMVDFGHAKGSTLEQVVEGVNEQANLRKYREALEAFNQFLEKLGPNYDDFVSQSDAKVAYEQMLEDKQLTLEDFEAVDFASLSEWKSEIRANLDEIQETADGLDYVAALLDLEAELMAVDEFLDEAIQEQAAEAKSTYESSAATHEATFTAADGTDDLRFYPLKQANEGYAAAKKVVDDLAAAEDWEEASAKLPAAAAAAQTFIDQRAGFDKCATEHARMAADIDYVVQLNKNAPRNPEWNEELKLLDSFNNSFNNGDFDQALADMLALESKIEALKERVAASDAESTPKAEAAADEIRNLAGGSDVSTLSNDQKEALVDELRKLSHKKQRQLLEDLHMPSTPLSGEQRAMQIALYNAMTLDKKFAKADGEIRDRYEAELAGDTELMNAVGDWNEVDPSGAPLVDRKTKEKMLRRILTAQSNAYGIDVPAIEWTEPSAPFAGQYKPSTGRLMVNPSYLNDPHAIIQAVIHENAHNFQDELVRQYVDGKISKSDPMYEQAKTFAATYGDDAYVEVTEDSMAYEFQPKEMHATDAGIFGADALAAG
ncbi:hypothetical protein OAS39_09605 [Pirellulales bacterium]|nr:hypothetical protein [Pirellulales bacterium]